MQENPNRAVLVAAISAGPDYRDNKVNSLGENEYIHPSFCACLAGGSSPIFPFEKYVNLVFWALYFWTLKMGKKIL